MRDGSFVCTLLFLLQETPLGDDVIADALHLLYGFLRGAFNVRPGLIAVDIMGPPARALEGASWTFAHLGKDVTVTVRKGTQVITPAATT